MYHLSIFNDGWRDHSYFEGYVSVGGRVRDSADFIAGLVDSWTPGMGAGGDGAFTSDVFSDIGTVESTGAWFYRIP